ncbi:HAMP domain-containing sensor histidine kinase [Neobacillus niacini]|uniref:sensor histidine kinase n=1 Tax=Neobacillus niacini TaxID=86668 RepID=UPI0021CB1BC3|nr:sensor histidine kinase [Neobacillus niacini]MCM3764597.1 sensor histidine kinase [Neobacillus niacini]
MNLKHYVADQKWQLITFFFVLLFIAVLVSVDPKLTVAVSSLIYLVIISFIIFACFFIGGYFFKRNQLKSWESFEELPVALTHEQEVYVQAFRKWQEHYLETIQEQNQTAKEQLEFMTQWFHEIKTPISVSRLLLETEVNSHSLTEEINKIEGYVEQALYFTRLHEFNKDYLIQEIDLEKLIKEIIKTEMKSFIAKKIKLTLNLKPATIFSDKKGLTYLIRQLLSNSLKYTGDHGEITITVNPEARELQICDTGIGIPPEDLPRVFEQGFTGSNGRTHQRSTGMGLYLAKKTADKLGHRLSLTSSPGKGTTATIYFPDRSEQLLQF